jgi:peptidoglycan/xylan/chitin deacetylase (PgdA/CDA1 family)
MPLIRMNMNKNLRNMLGYLAANTLIFTGRVKQATRKALDTECILSLYYHKPAKDEFEFSIKWLQKKGFKFISPHDLERIINREIAFPKGAVLLTVDDGWQTNVTNVVEVANRNQVPVTIFVSTTPAEEGTYWWSYVNQARRQGLTSFSKQALKKMPEEERLNILNDIKQMIYPGRDAMTVDQVKMVARSPYVTIGSHTKTHPILINCPEMQVYEELKGSRQKLESWIGKEVAYFAYPNGDYSRREIKILKTLNYRLAFSAQPKYLTPALLNESFTIPRFGFLEGASSAENICRMTGVWQPMMWNLSHKNLKPKKERAWLKDLLLGEDRIQKLDI